MFDKTRLAVANATLGSVRQIELARIATDPIFNRATRDEAFGFGAAIRGNKVWYNDASVDTFVSKCRADAERDVFATPIASQSWIQHGLWSETAAS